ncbi:hypothetical protein JKP88DRAFT_159754 [Tribonema minus]|uniref:FZ domain-containing protein n=1 Tax=Tribonema minus TaxID=303371 RepID=A0A835ZE42_9STRA|nr:hypothetical protein JKP88DRAFT_159754 [Tribonema minus]
MTGAKDIKRLSRWLPVRRIFAAVVFTWTATVHGCRLQGLDIGQCNTDVANDELYRLQLMPFCGPYVRYTACLPKQAPLPPSRDHPQGRWWNHTVAHKDDWVREYYERIVGERVAIEKDKSLQKAGRDEFGARGAPVPRFSNNPDCRDAFRNYACWTNFPRCIEETGETLMTCHSACENMMIACRIPKDLWRCGPSEYLNGYSPEAPTLLSGVVTYLRDFYPGQPFAANAFEQTRRQDPLPVCTPSLDGAAAALRAPWAAAALAAALAAVLAACA